MGWARSASPFLLASLAAAWAPAAAQTLGALQFSADSPAPDTATRQFIESQPARPEVLPPAPRAAAAPPPRPASPPADGFIMRDPALVRQFERYRDAVRQPPREAAPPPAEARAFTLWEGLREPLDLGAERAAEAAPDEASRLGRRDYESHILGRRPEPVRPSGSDPASGQSRPRPSAVGLAARAPASETPELFVAVDLDARDGKLQDAVAGLSGAVAFRPDPRFPPAAAFPARPNAPAYRVWGWLPAAKLGRAVAVPSVRRLQIEPRPAVKTPARAPLTTEIVVGLRAPLPEAAAPQSSAPGREAARLLGELTSVSGFRWTRTIGYQRLPGPPSDPTPRGALVVVGEVPVAELGRLMAHPDVLKVMPAAAAVRARAPQPAPDRAGGFLGYVVDRAPLLLVATLALLLPPLAALVLRGARVFVPYQ